jgi:hypothetical protein
MQDDLNGQLFSEHAQCLALLAGLFDDKTANNVVDTLLSDSTLCRTSVYFQFYLFEVLIKYGRADEVVKRFDFWRSLADLGFKTTVEEPEPSRSDCHAWGAHPMFHMAASLFGLRPVQPGMREVIIAPQPGGLENMQGRIPCPQGDVVFDLQFNGEECRGSIDLPSGMEATFKWKTHEMRFSGSVKL